MKIQFIILLSIFTTLFLSCNKKDIPTKYIDSSFLNGTWLCTSFPCDSFVYKIKDGYIEYNFWAHILGEKELKHEDYSYGKLFITDSTFTIENENCVEHYLYEIDSKGQLVLKYPSSCTLIFKRVSKDIK